MKYTHHINNRIHKSHICLANRTNGKYAIHFVLFDDHSMWLLVKFRHANHAHKTDGFASSVAWNASGAVHSIWHCTESTMCQCTWATRINYFLSFSMCFFKFFFFFLLLSCALIAIVWSHLMQISSSKACMF